MLYSVPMIPQTQTRSCWAASIAMILKWKYGDDYTDVMIADNPGGLSYMTSMTSGLDPNDKTILRENGFILDFPMCYTPELIDRMLLVHGPLWVATWAPGPHIRVVTGIMGNTVYINDPWPVGVGSIYSQPFDQFFGAMEELGSFEMSEPSPVYVAYLR